MNPPKNILIVRTDRIGDVVLSLPLAQIIKKHFPDCKITFLIREYTRPLAEGNPNIDEVITLKEKNGKPSLAKNITMLKNKFDVCIFVYPTFPIALILFFSSIKTRIGTGYRWYSFLFNKKIYDHRKYGERHELEYNIRLLQLLEIDEQINFDNVTFGIAISKQSEEKISEVLKSIRVDNQKPIIIFHPGSGGSSFDLPLHKMKGIINSLKQEPVKILITGNEAEKELCQSLVVNNSIINLAGQFNLSELIALINKCDLMIANSTGPIHIAAALGKYVIGFYPKIPSCSSKRWGPYTNKKIIFSPTIDCNNCTRQQCEKLNCMESIRVEEVVKAVKDILENSKMYRR